jgi:hypothetical protein
VNSDATGHGPDREADERIIDAMFQASHSTERLDEERRIQAAMDAIRASEDAKPAVAVAAAPARRRWWIALGGVGSIAALVAITVLSQPAEVRAERIIARAKIAAESVHSRRFDVVIESPLAINVPDREGWVEVLSRPAGHPLLRFEVQEPSDQARVWGVDEQGGWGRTPDGLVTRFRRTEWSDRILGGGLDLLVDAIPAMLSRVEQGYDLVAATTRTMSPTLVATRRNAIDSKSPDRIRVEFDADTYEVSFLVLEWDRFTSGSSGDRVGESAGPPARVTFTRRATTNLDASGFDPGS